MFMLIVCRYFVDDITTQNRVRRTKPKLRILFHIFQAWLKFWVCCKMMKSCGAVRALSQPWAKWLPELFLDGSHSAPTDPPPQLQQRKFSITVSFYSQLIIFAAIVKPGAWKPPRVCRVADVNERSHLKAALWCQRQRHRLRRRYSAALLRRFKSSALLLSSLSSAHVAAASTGVAHLFQRLLRQQLSRVSLSWAKSSLQGEKGKIVVQGFFFFLSDYCRKCVQPVTLTFRANRGTRCWQ